MRNKPGGDCLTADGAGDNLAAAIMEHVRTYPDKASSMFTCSMEIEMPGRWAFSTKCSLRNPCSRAHALRPLSTKSAGPGIP